MNDTQKRPLEPEPTEMEEQQDDAKRHDGKGTPNKPKTDPNGRVQPKLADEETEETPCHGSTNWCASRTLCANLTNAAGKELCCTYCNLYVHKECKSDAEDGKISCTRCAEINTCDTILRSEDSVGKDEKQVTTDCNNQSDDMTVTSTATEVAANVSTFEESVSNISSKSAQDDKQELVNFITIKKGINAQSEDKYIHIVANIAGVSIGLEDLPMVFITQMVEDIKKALLHVSFNRKALISNRYKILAEFTGIKPPKSPHSKQVKDKILKYCLTKYRRYQATWSSRNPLFRKCPRSLAPMLLLIACRS
jgi:hypothetical protein